MSDMFWEDDNGGQRESNAMRALREKAEADSKKITDLTEAVSKLTEELHSTKVKDVVTNAGLDPRVADLAKQAVGTDPQAVEAWLKDNGDLFAKPVGAPAGGSEGQEPAGATGEEQPGGQSEVPADEQAALAALAAAAQGSEPAKGLEAVANSMSEAKTPEDVERLLQTLRPSQG